MKSHNHFTALLHSSASRKIKIQDYHQKLTYKCSEISNFAESLRKSIIIRLVTYFGMSITRRKVLLRRASTKI